MTWREFGRPRISRIPEDNKSACSPDTLGHPREVSAITAESDDALTYARDDAA